MKTYDAIVLGVGGFGSAAMFHLAARGVRVLGLEQFSAVHDRGSSHGHTRIIRQAYCEHPDYVPLVQQAFDLWDQLEQRRGEKLYHQVGLLEVGPADGMVVSGVLESAQQHHLPVDQLTHKEAAERFPGFVIPPEADVVFENRAGYLLVEACVKAHLEEAEKLGAELQTGVAVKRFHCENGGVKVETETETFAASRLVVTAGAWTKQLLSDLNISLKVLRKHVYWFENQDPRYMNDPQRDQQAPGFLFELPEGIFYGFPHVGDHGVKVGRHNGGEVVADPSQVDRSDSPDEQRDVRQFIRSFLPGVSHDLKDYSVCMYTMSPDDHFIVDRHPEHEQVVFAAGMSGHGFKFTTVLGQALADLALDGKTSLPIEFLSCRRFA